MALELALDHLTEAEFLDEHIPKRLRAGGTDCTRMITSIKLFTKDSFGMDLDDVMEELRGVSDINIQIGKCLVLLQKFANWMDVAHPEIQMPRKDKVVKFCVAKDSDTIKNYISQARIYLRKVGGIRITTDDVKSYLKYPEPQDKDEVEPLLPEEFKIILRFASPHRGLLYRIAKDCEARIGAMAQLRKKDFDTTVRPIAVTFDKSILKKKNGISFTNVKYVIKEDESDLLNHLDRLQDNDLVFGINEDPRRAINTEEQAWIRLMHRIDRLTKKIHFTLKYSHNNRLKKNMHSIKAFTFTAAEEAVNETYANAYGDHSRYTKNYLRWTKEKKIAKFRLLEPYISLFTEVKNETTEVIELRAENQLLTQKLSEHDGILQTLVSQKVSKTKIPADDKTKEMILKLLKENNLI